MSICGYITCGWENGPISSGTRRRKDEQAHVFDILSETHENSWELWFLDGFRDILPQRKHLC